MKQLDYAEAHNWMHLPARVARTKPVDVFFAYPTVYFHPDKKRHHLMPIHSPFYRRAARFSTWWHDRIFARSCNIFVPYYRQVGMETLFMRRPVFDRLSLTPYEDLQNAFMYYIHNCNDGRPFLLGGHSQGSELLIKLMCRTFGSLKAASRLVASYLIGYSITLEDLRKHPHVRMAECENDLGVVISYNTSARGLELLPVVRPHAVCINPLNWARDETYAPRSMNQGSVLLETRHLVIEKKHFTGARIDREQGVVLIDDGALGFLNKALVRRHNLHALDIALFQRNLESNIETRIRRFFEENPSFGPLPPDAFDAETPQRELDLP